MWKLENVMTGESYDQGNLKTCKALATKLIKREGYVTNGEFNIYHDDQLLFRSLPDDGYNLRWQKVTPVMRPNIMLRDFYHGVYNILVKDGGALESNRHSFLYAHIESEHLCREWRFSGFFGFGGKYRSHRNTIDYYPENKSEKLEKLEKAINDKLIKLFKKYKKNGLALKVEDRYGYEI
jgi:hypothetical protein